MRTLIGIMVVCACSIVVAQPSRTGLRIVVIDGDEAANIVAEKMAAEPVIEVRDREDRRVAGAVVRFGIKRTLRNRLPAVFRDGRSEVRTLTDATGRARAAAVTPLEPGSYEIDVEVSYQGETTTATMRQTNYATAAEARADGRQPVQSSGLNAGVTGGEAASGGAGAGGATASVPAGGAVPAAIGSASGVAAGVGGGVSKALVGTLVAGGGAAAGAVVVLNNRAASNADPTIGDIFLSRNVALAYATPVEFSIAASDPDGNSLTYQWDFGDGTSASVPSPAHVYNTPGAFTASVTVSDGRASLKRSASVTVKSLTGTWVTDPRDCRAFPDGPVFTCHTVYTLVQSERAISGSAVIVGRPPQWDPGTIVMTGSVRTASPFVVASGRFDVPIPSITTLQGDPDPLVDSLISNDITGLVYRRQ